MVCRCLTSFWEIKMPAASSSRNLTWSRLRIRYLWISHRPSQRFNQEWTTSCPRSLLTTISSEGYWILLDRRIQPASSINKWPFATSRASWPSLCPFMNTLPARWLTYLRVRKTS
jgi:hypothetical protein